MTTTLTILGITDEVTACECCGRQDLKRTVVLGDSEGNVFAHYGTDCAAQALGRTSADVTKAARSAKKAAAEQAARDRQRKMNEHWAAYDAWKMATYGDTTNNLERSRRYRAETTN